MILVQYELLFVVLLSPFKIPNDEGVSESWHLAANFRGTLRQQKQAIETSKFKIIENQMAYLLDYE